MKKRILFSLFGLMIFLVGLSVSASAQNNRNQQREGEINVIRDQRIDKLVDRHIWQNSQRTTAPGFRVQLHASNSREQAQRMASDFSAQFPQYTPYVIFHAPDFRVRAGDFRSRVEAYHLLRQVSQVPAFRDAFIVPDEVALQGLQ